MPLPRYLTFVAVLGLSLLAACTWVRPDPGAERIAVAGPDAAAGCERLGETSTSVRDRVSGVQRRPGKVEQELDALARNSALEMGGDLLVPLTDVRDGRRSYAVYRCPGRRPFETTP